MTHATLVGTVLLRRPHPPAGTLSEREQSDRQLGLGDRCVRRWWWRRDDVSSLQCIRTDCSTTCLLYCHTACIVLWCTTVFANHRLLCVMCRHISSGGSRVAPRDQAVAQDDPAARDAAEPPAVAAAVAIPAASLRLPDDLSNDRSLFGAPVATTAGGGWDATSIPPFSEPCLLDTVKLLSAPQFMSAFSRGR